MLARIIFAVLVTSLMIVKAGICQQVDTRAQFEAVSVKPSAPVAYAIAGMKGGPGTGDPSRLHYTNILLDTVISQALDVPSWRISKPGWLNEVRFDIEATLPPDTTKEQFRTMLQRLLIDRFKMVWHTEKMDITGFSLRIAKNGPLFHEAGNIEDEISQATHSINGPGSPGSADGVRIDADGFSWMPFHAGLNFAFAHGQTRARSFGGTMDDLARMLGNRLQRPVENETGLTGKYDYTLTFEMTGLGRIPVPGVEEREYAPNVQEALSHELGLKLERKKATVDRIIIDSISRNPEEN